MEARWHSSSAIIGLMPVRCPYKAFCTEVGEVEIQFLKTSSVTSRGFSFAMVWGIKYSRPGRTVFDAVDDSSVFFTEDNVAVFSHDLYDQALSAQVS